MSKCKHGSIPGHGNECPWCQCARLAKVIASQEEAHLVLLGDVNRMKQQHDSVFAKARRQRDQLEALKEDCRQLVAAWERDDTLAIDEAFDRICEATSDAADS